MKDNLEKAFINSLEEYEVAYDPKAWEAVSAKLGSNAAAGGSAVSSALKWVLAAVLVGTVVTGSYFLWNNDTEPTRTETAIVENEKQSEISTTETNEKAEEKIPKDVAENKDEAIISPEKIVETQRELVPVVNGKETPTQKAPVSVKEPKKDVVIEKENIKNPPLVFVEELAKKDRFTAGNISNTIVCAGETVEISNPTKKDKVRFQINGATFNLDSGESIDITLSESSPIRFVNEKDDLIEVKFIKVHDASTPDFNLEANIFEAGLPVVIAEAYGDFASYSWKFDGEVERQGAVVKHNFFDKGEYDITLKVTDANGCEAVTSKTVRIRDKYNLMAMDAFKPNGSDARNRAFMPYSLTERDARFQLTIVDPIDNGIVFTSTDSNEAWDGKDQRTGKMTPSNKSFIWKVQIFNPELGERPIYAGTVVHN